MKPYINPLLRHHYDADGKRKPVGPASGFGWLWVLALLALYLLTRFA